MIGLQKAVNVNYACTKTSFVHTWSLVIEFPKGFVSQTCIHHDHQENNDNTQNYDCYYPFPISNPITIIIIIIIIIFSLVLDNCPWKKYVLQDIENKTILCKK